jgi:predicted nucleic acid-binding protein
MFSQTGLIHSAVQIASDSRLTVYDSLYLSLAQELKATLLSLDTEQSEVAKRLGLTVVRA